MNSETVQDEVDNLEGVSIESKSDLQDHLDALYHYEGEEGEQLGQGYVDEVWDRLVGTTDAVMSNLSDISREISVVLESYKHKEDREFLDKWNEGAKQ